MIKKHNKLIAVLAFSLSGVLPLATLNNMTLTQHRQHKSKSKSIAQTSITKRVNVGRKVHKFTGLHSVNDQNLFKKLQEQLTSTNIDIKLNSSPNYEYAIKYDNYDVFNDEHKGLISYIDSTKSTNNSIEVGLKLLEKMKVSISKKTKKDWKSLKLNSLTKLDFKKVDPASVFYSISASGSKSSPTVTISRSYTNRDSKTPKSQIFGYFNVNNINHNAKYFFKHPGGIATIITVIALVLIILAIVIATRIGYVRYKNLPSFFNTKSVAVIPEKIEDVLIPENLEEPEIFETQGVGDGNLVDTTVPGATEENKLNPESIGVTPTAVNHPPVNKIVTGLGTDDLVDLEQNKSAVAKKAFEKKSVDVARTSRNNQLKQVDSTIPERKKPTLKIQNRPKFSSLSSELNKSIVDFDRNNLAAVDKNPADVAGTMEENQLKPTGSANPNSPIAAKRKFVSQNAGATISETPKPKPRKPLEPTTRTISKTGPKVAPKPNKKLSWFSDGKTWFRGYKKSSEAVEGLGKAEQKNPAVAKVRPQGKVVGKIIPNLEKVLQQGVSGALKTKLQQAEEFTEEIIADEQNWE